MTNRLTAHSVNSEIQQILIQTMNGRMYDSLIARIFSPDAYVQAPGYTQSYNRYSYCLNNPLRYTDPSGWQMAPLGEFWNLGAENLEMRIGTYYPPGLGGGRSGGYSYNSNTGEYTNGYGDHVTFDQVNMNYIIPNAILNVSGSAAGELVSRVRDGFSLYSYNFYGRQNLVLSIGDPKVVANTDGDGGYFTRNPTAGYFAYGVCTTSIRANVSSRFEERPQTHDLGFGKLTITPYAEIKSDRDGVEFNFVNKISSGVSYNFGPISAGITKEGFSGSISTRNVSLTFSPISNSTSLGIYNTVGQSEIGFEVSFQPDWNTVLLGAPYNKSLHFSLFC